MLFDLVAVAKEEQFGKGDDVPQWMKVRLMPKGTCKCNFLPFIAAGSVHDWLDSAAK